MFFKSHNLQFMAILEKGTNLSLKLLENPEYGISLLQ